MIKVSVIIVTYNSKEFLKKCLESLSEEKEIEIIVVDNNSRDGTRSLFKNQNKINYIWNDQNLGFSKANNIGVKKSKGKYLLFLNPDTVVPKGTIFQMFEFMEKTEEAGASTCKVILPNKKMDDASHRGFPTPWNSLCYFLGLPKLFPKSKTFSGYTLGWENLNETHEIDSLAGAFMFVKRKAGEEVGWWDEDYFFYGEDIDFCFRLKEKGWKIYYYPKVSILHFKGISSGIKSHSKHLSMADIETQKAATVARFDAMKIFYRKHYRNKYSPVVNFFVDKAINLKFWYSTRGLRV